MQYEYLEVDCHDNKKWAFLSDLARLLIIYQEGGIYYDTDVELIKKPDQLLKNEAFYGFENEQNIATGLGFGACMNHPSLLRHDDIKATYENLET
ncbi:MAG: glycosyltransferase [Eubacterium ramulus]